MIAEFREGALGSFEVTKSHHPNGLSLPNERRRTFIILSWSKSHCGLAGARNVTAPIVRVGMRAICRQNLSKICHCRAITYISPQFAPFAILDYPQSSASMLRIVGRCRAISCQFSPSSRLAKTEPLLVPK